MNNNDTLKEDEFHPSAISAFSYIKSRLFLDPLVVEAVASSALSGNRTAEICYGTITRIKNNEPVSDRYLLGLAWLLKKIKWNKQ